MKNQGGSGDAARAHGELRMLQTLVLLLLYVSVQLVTAQQNSSSSTSAPDDTRCGRDPCQNDAYCEDGKDAYVCVCQQGWKGTNCDQDVDECQEVPNACNDTNSHCVNGVGNFSCVCNDGYERQRPDEACKENVLLPYKNSRTTKHQGEKRTMGPFYFPQNFMIGDTSFDLYYISVNGYIVFNTRYDEPFMAPLNTSRLTFKSFLAPYWTSLDLSPQGSEDSGLYHTEVFLSSAAFNNDSKALFEEYTALMGLESFEPVYISVVTWVGVLPFKAADYQGMETATFQVAMATDGRSLKGRVAWRNTWRDLHKFRVKAYMHLTADTAQSWMPLAGSTPKYLNFSSTSDHTQSLKPCVVWLGTHTTEMGKYNSEILACPGSLAMAQAHPLYETSRESSTDKRHCVISKVFDHFQTKKKFCCYRVVDGVMLKARTEIPLDKIRDARINSLAADGYVKCCEANHSMACSAFREVFPVPKLYVESGFLLKSALLWGNGHFATLDNLTYTFNGWSEYLLLELRLNVVEFQFHGRAEKVASSAYNTTVFTAFAIQYGNATPFEMHVDNGQIKLYREGQETSAGAVSQEGRVVLRMSDSKDVLDLTFSLYTMMKVMASGDHLSVSILMYMTPAIYMDGLLGGGTSLTNQSSQDLFQSAQRWALAENQTLFTYNKPGESFSTYQHPGFVPTFLPSGAGELLQELNQTNKMAEGRTVCGENVACLQDFLVTGSGVRGQQTKKVEDDSSKLEKLLKEEAPYIPWTLTFWRSSGRGHQRGRIRAFSTKSTKDTGPDPNVTIRGETIPEDVVTNFTIRKYSTLWRTGWTVGDNVTSLTSFSVTVTVTNPLNGIVVELWPALMVCVCGRYCDDKAVEYRLEEVESPYGGFAFAECLCNSSYGGRFCEEAVDACEVCYDPDICYEITPGRKRCVCPLGYEGDGKYCSEKNECLQPNRCQQVCTNTAGSYRCQCFSGYTLQDNDRCEDIDECQRQTHNCSAKQFCVNTVGSFVCQCRSDFGGKDCQEDVKHRYGGQVSFVDLPSRGQGWSDDLLRIDSVAFREMSNKVESVIASLLRNRGFQFVGVSVFDFSHSKPVRQRRSTGQGTAMIGATFEVSTTQQQDVTSLQSAILSGFDPACTGSRCRLFGNSNETSDLLYGVEKANFEFKEDYDLCGSVRTNNCHNTTTTCVTVNGTSLCQCRPGYKPWSLQDNICLDEDECQMNSTKALCGISSNGTECRNTDGSYYCLCPDSFRWDADKMKCVEVTLKDVCMETKPCKNEAECVNTMDEARYACRCTDGWTGADCGQEDAEAERFRSATIGVSVTLAILCIIVIIVIVVIFVRRGRITSPEAEVQEHINGHSKVQKMDRGNTGGHTHSTNGTSGQEFPNPVFSQQLGGMNVCERL